MLPGAQESLEPQAVLRIAQHPLAPRTTPPTETGSQNGRVGEWEGGREGGTRKRVREEREREGEGRERERERK